MRTTRNSRVLQALEYVKATPRKSQRVPGADSFTQAVSKTPRAPTAMKPLDSFTHRAEKSASPLRYYPTQRNPTIPVNLAKLNIYCTPYFENQSPPPSDHSEFKKPNRTHHKSHTEMDISPIISFRSKIGVQEQSPSPTFRHNNKSQTPISFLKIPQNDPIKRNSLFSQSSSREKFLTQKRDTLISNTSNGSGEFSPKKITKLPLHLISSAGQKKLIKIVNPKVTKVDKILNEIRESSTLKILVKDQKASEQTLDLVSTKDNSSLRMQTNSDDQSPYGLVSRRVVTEGDHSPDHLKFPEISKKLTDYRALFKSQAHDLEKVRAPFIKRKETISLSHTPQSHPHQKNEKPPLQKKMTLTKNKLAKKILAVLKKMSLLNLTMDEILKHKVFPSYAYEHEGSRALFDYVKTGNIIEIKKTLAKNKYYVYDFDYAKETCLHWAAKRNYIEIIKLLLEKGADPNAIDLSGRTPLFLAAKGQFKYCIQLLLYHGADPTIRSQNNKLAENYTTNPDIIELLGKASAIHEKLRPLKTKDSKKAWDLFDKTAFRVKIMNGK